MRGSTSSELGMVAFFGLSRLSGMNVTRPDFSLSMASRTLEAVSSVSTTTWNKLKPIEQLANNLNEWMTCYRQSTQWRC